MGGKHLLIVLLGSLGDVARGLFVARHIKLQRPNWKISWLVERKSLGLVELSPDVDQIIIFERQLGLEGLRKLKLELAANYFDICLDLQRHLKSGVFSWLSAAKQRIGFPVESSKEFNWLFQTEYAQKRAQPVAKLTQYFDLLQALGLSLPVERDQLKLEPIKFKPVVSELAQDINQQSGANYIALVISTSWHSKYWPAEYYQQFISEILLKTSLSIVLLGDPKDGAQATKFASDRRVISTLGRTSIADLVAILIKSKLAIGPDCGPAHISALIGLPYIAIFGATDANITAPYGVRNRILQAELPCSPCYLRRCPGLGNLCMRLVKPQQVFEAALQALNP